MAMQLDIMGSGRKSLYYFPQFFFFSFDVPLAWWPMLHLELTFQQMLFTKQQRKMRKPSRWTNCRWL